MSTERTDRGDREYGPTPPGAGHEHTDVDPSIAVKFALWMGAAMIAGGAIVYGTFVFFERGAATRDEAAQAYPLAAGRAAAPPAPRLQTEPFTDAARLRQAADERLSSYGWVDRDAGIVHIPIDDAMRIVAARGLPVREGAAAGAAQRIVQDASGGRTLAPR